MPKKKARELIGTFHIGPQLSGLGQIHFLRTKDGNHWLLDVEAERVHWLDGLEVIVKGRSEGSRIEVSSITQA
jgi:hypothetical protein